MGVEGVAAFFGFAVPVGVTCTLVGVGVAGLVPGWLIPVDQKPLTMPKPISRTRKRSGSMPRLHRREAGERLNKESVGTCATMRLACKRM